MKFRRNRYDDLTNDALLRTRYDQLISRHPRRENASLYWEVSRSLFSLLAVCEAFDQRRDRKKKSFSHLPSAEQRGHKNWNFRENQL